MRWKCTFIGRLVGAIGIMHPCEVIVEARDEAEARMRCYDTHDHIMSFAAVTVDTDQGPRRSGGA